MPENINESFSSLQQTRKAYHFPSPQSGEGGRRPYEDGEGSGVRYDIIGIGIGPFNLGLAALCHSIPELDCLFIEKNKEFNWHPGLMIPGTKLQVPFYADLVTLANPKSDFSFMEYIHATKKMFRFAILENYFITRKEYNEYCRWVASLLPSLQFNCCCTAIRYDESKEFYSVETNAGTYHARHIVIGTGTIPFIPEFAKKTDHPFLFHSSDFLYAKDRLLNQKSVTLVGSGQSAAEIFYDLLSCYNGKLFWFTRSSAFFPMDYSKFALEKTSPHYIDHFYSLPQHIKSVVLKKQDYLYKGINAELIENIYAALYEKNSPHIHLHPNCELKAICDELNLTFRHTELQQDFQHRTDAVILATGYRGFIPDFINPIRHRIQWMDNGSYGLNRNYSIDGCNQVFVQNADLHTHGFNSADLGLGPYRNTVILNTILQKEHFAMEKGISFQTFGLP